MDERSSAGLAAGGLARELAAARQLTEALMRTAPVGMAAADREAVLIRVNPALCELLGRDESELLGGQLREFLHPDDRAVAAEALATALGRRESEPGYQHVYRFLRPDGAVRDVLVGVSLVRDSAGLPVEYLGQFVDLTERVAVERRLRRTVRQQAAVVALGERAVGGDDAATLMDAATRAVAAGLDADFVSVLEAVGSDAVVLRAGFGFPADELGRVRPLTEAARSAQALLARGPLRTLGPAADSAPLLRVGVEASVSAPIGNPMEPFGLLGAHRREAVPFEPEDEAFLQSVATIVWSATERGRSEGRLRHQALHDDLTGLPNRTLLLDRLEHALAAHARSRRQVAVLFLDLDDFKLVNDSLGHAEGDRLLCQVAERLCAAMRPSDTVARFGGDEFVVVAEDLARGDDALRVAERIRAQFEQPFALGGDVAHTVTASIGIALARAGRRGAEHLLRDADAAMYAAKRGGRGRVELRRRHDHRRLLARVRTEQELRHAVGEGELTAYFQPLVNLPDGSPMGAEVLCRWRHPRRGLLAPGEFIDIAEESGLIVPIGEQMLREGCAQAVTWPGEPLLSVNLSPRQLTPALVDAVMAALTGSGLPGRQLMLEITERMLTDDHAAVARVLAQLKELGVRLALDDFGTGYSSLTHLKRYPIDFVKIDGSFVHGVPEDPNDTTIVRAIVGMAWALGMRVIPEGIENPRQLDWLRSFGCRYGQGHHFSPPVPAERFAELVAGRA